MYQIYLNGNKTEHNFNFIVDAWKVAREIVKQAPVFSAVVVVDANTNKVETLFIDDANGVGVVDLGCKV